MPATKTLQMLQSAAHGLTFPSESDESWHAFAWPEGKGEPTAEGVRTLGTHRCDSPVEERTPDDLFAPLVEDQDWFGDDEIAIAARYRELRDVIRTRLKQVKVFRFGERQIAVYVVGLCPEGGWAGVKTVAVET